SLGGIVALQMLADHADRFRTLATFGTAYALDLPTAAAGLIPLLYRVPGRQVTAAVTAWSTTRDRAARRLIREVLADFDPAVGHAVAANLVRYDLIANAVVTRVPILLLRCGRDHGVNRALPRTLAALAGQPHVTQVAVPEGGHCANL